MGYVGNQSTNSYSSMVKQDLTGASGASVTLSHPVANANEVELYINNVRQEPTTSYTTSGTTLSFVGYTVAASDDIYVIFSGKALQTVVPPDGSVSTAKIADDAVTNAKINNSTIDLTSKVTGVLPVANGGTGVSSPILVYARKSNGNVSTASTIIWNTEMVDTAGAYNNTTGVFTCPKSGHYEVHWHYLHRFPGYLRTTLQKNGTYIWGSGQKSIIYNRNVDSTDESQVSGMAIVNCSVNDTLSIYFIGRSGTSDIYGEQNSHNGFLVKFLG